MNPISMYAHVQLAAERRQASEATAAGWRLSRRSKRQAVAPDTAVAVPVVTVRARRRAGLAPTASDCAVA
jgi:hypothetical protein